VALGVVLALCLARGLAWTLMFTADDPRTLASRWIASHAHDGDIVVAESEHHYTAPLGGADEPTGALPYPMPRIEIRRLFSGGELGRAIPVHSTRLLRGARYLVLSDWMLRRALSEPGTLRSSDHAVLYAALLDGRHGYTEVARFDREPRLGPLVWHEDHDEQLAICFDHCPVRILERTGEYVSPFASPEGPASESE
jgi:hypothetical protein